MIDLYTLNNQGPFFHCEPTYFFTKHPPKKWFLRASGRDHRIKEKQPRKWRNAKDELSQILNVWSINLHLGSSEGYQALSVLGYRCLVIIHQQFQVPKMEVLGGVSLT